MIDLFFNMFLLSPDVFNMNCVHYRVKFFKIHNNVVTLLPMASPRVHRVPFPLITGEETLFPVTRHDFSARCIMLMSIKGSCAHRYAERGIVLHH